MSWQAYVDDQICSLVQCRVAVIAGFDDGGIWAKRESDPNFQISPGEIKFIVDTMKSNPAAFNESGIHIGGEKYICLFADSTLLRGRKGSSALCIVATEKCLIAATSVEGVQAGQLNLVVEKLGDYLRMSGY